MTVNNRTWRHVGHELGLLPPLAGYFLHCAPAVALLAGDKKPGLSRAYQKLIKEMWSRKTRGYVVPSGILYGIRNVHGMFRGYQQHDTQEFLRCFLDQLHEELKEPVYDDASHDKLNTEDGDHTVTKNVHMRRRAASSGASDAPLFARMRRKSPAPSSYSERTDGYFRVHSTSESGAAPRAATRHRRSASFAGTQQASYYTHVANGEKEHSRVDIGSESSLSCSSDAEERYETCSSASDSQLPHTKELPGCGGDGGGARYRSVVSDVFDGKLLSSVQCLICNRVSTRVETFQDLSLPIPSREHLSVLRAQQHALATQMTAPEHDSWLWWVLGWLRSWFYGPVVSLQDCLAAFFSADELKGDNMYSCSRCSKLRNGVKISRLVRLPEVVCIHLKRFRHELAYSSKLAAAVTFPTTSLDLAPYRHPRMYLLSLVVCIHLKRFRYELAYSSKLAAAVTFPTTQLDLAPYRHPQCTSKITRYSLAAVICHSGTAGGGHYTCAALNDNQWYSFDDASVSRVTHAQLAAHEAYVLFYR
ncbi:hypothetical protein JYU34_015272 [Plutella xylostella]|uniref:ubiquitinyl hydrolase 1 n=1 Tax=Plutella xylostella TaxID=51655 RepID=A0ABQ7QAF0_PLUXY|nr:hypothetical protein JYU34_015272 [Plutella xylostella]